MQPWELDTRQYRASAPECRRATVVDPYGIPLRPGWRVGENARRHLLEMSLDALPLPSGQVLEFGVLRGRSLRWIAAYLGPEALVDGFDSYEGLPESWVESDASTIRRGGFFQDHAARPVAEDWPDNVRMHVGDVRATTEAVVLASPEPVRFAHLDLDVYLSTVAALRALAPRVVVGTVLHFDELWDFKTWRDHEWKALVEVAAERGWRWRVLHYLDPGYQAAVEITGV